MKINGYELLGDWEVSNIGHTAQATRSDKKFFLKRYGEYKLPRRDKSMTDALYAKMQSEFDSFKDNRIAINRALSEFTGTGGSLIIPTQWFVHDVCFIEATEFVNGLIEDEEILKLSLDDKVFVMSTAAAALHNVHKKNIVHSDLKRTNILAARNSFGRVTAKIIDFDRSYFADNIRPDELGGDQNFMSPELADCFIYDMADEALECLSTKSDIFSLGLVFHDYLVSETYTDDTGVKHVRGCHPKIVGLTGKLKERSDSGKTVYCCEALLAGAKLVVSDKIKENYLRHLIAAMLQPNPEDRPTAREVLEVLRTKKVMELKSDAILLSGGKDSGATPVGDKMSISEPSGFCEPWPEHAIEFIVEKLEASGFVAAERFDKDGRKYYNLIKRGGGKLLFPLETLIILGLAKRADGGVTTTDKPKVSPVATKSEATSASSECVTYDDGQMWEEDSEFAYDMDVITACGYKSIARAEKNGIKGYVLIKHSGEQRFTSIYNLRLLKFVVNK